MLEEENDLDPLKSGDEIGALVTVTLKDKTTGNIMDSYAIVTEVKNGKYTVWLDSMFCRGRPDVLKNVSKNSLRWIQSIGDDAYESDSDINDIFPNQ